jgi:hypothetical protein
VVWGFTAQLLTSLFDLVHWAVPWDESRVIELPDRIVESSLRDMERAGVDFDDLRRTRGQQLGPGP